MSATVMHQPRVAWEASRTLVDVACSDVEIFAWYRDQVSALLGPVCHRELLATRTRLENPQRDDAFSVEVGRWRVRFEDELRNHAEITEGLHLLTMATRRRALPVGPGPVGSLADAVPGSGDRTDSTDGTEGPSDGDLGLFRLG
ncbi:MAG: hypothetical protein HOW97_01940 [Catenulispora sp.]|nr:hypothetical protein [Catenulispora sp.]